MIDDFLLEFQQLLVLEHREIDPLLGTHVLFVKIDLCFELLFGAKGWRQFDFSGHRSSVQDLVATLLQVCERRVHFTSLTTVKKVLVVLAGGQVGAVAI